jgi:hypothetical protein
MNENEHDDDFAPEFLKDVEQMAAEERSETQPPPADDPRMHNRPGWERARRMWYWVALFRNGVGRPTATPAAQPYPEPGGPIPDRWYGYSNTQEAQAAYDALHGATERQQLEFDRATLGRAGLGEVAIAYLQRVSKIDWDVVDDPQWLPQHRDLRVSEAIQGRLEKLSDAEVLIEGLITIRCYYHAEHFLLLGCVGRSDIQEKYYFWWRWEQIALQLGYRQLEPYAAPQQQEYEKAAAEVERREALGLPPYDVEESPQQDEGRSPPA